MGTNDEAAAADFMENLGSVLPSRGRVCVIPHDFPDPDALASAAGMVLLLSRHFKLKGDILYTGTVSRAENRELLRQFRYTWRLTARVARPTKPVPAILVDTSPWSGNVTIPDYATPVAVIDHHPQRAARLRQDLALDIRVGAGATCTIVHEYLAANEIPIPKWLCTIMAYAIASETLDLSRDSTQADLDAYVSLLARANLGNLGRIRHAPLPREYYATLQVAMQNAKVYGRVAWTHLPVAPQPEIVAEVADLLHRLERVTWAFCTARMNGRILVSIRSSDPRARCGRLLKKSIGRSGRAGGHHHMAAGYIDAADAAGEDGDARREVLVQDLVTAIERRSRRQRGGEEEPICAQPLIGGVEPPLGEGEEETTP